MARDAARLKIGYFPLPEAEARGIRSLLSFSGSCCVVDPCAGIIPSSICTCSAEGTSNITNLSVVQRIDSRHVGLSYQFFNKTLQNIGQNPFVQVVVVSPANGWQYRLDLRYERTGTEGHVFEKMNTRLDAVASQTGMSQRRSRWRRAGKT